jgi:isoaspartyl peptidase/L-asparaginase-like protein (Ntn-hydrolase superfamily)
MAGAKLPDSFVRAARKVMDENPEMVDKLEKTVEVARSSLMNSKLKPALSEEFRKRLKKWSRGG